MKKRVSGFVAVVTLIAGLSFGQTAFAGDHLANAIGSPGAAQRGFVNPVAQNPSGVSGAAAQPGTVPGEGDPNSGQDLGTPSVNCELLNPNANPAFCE